MAYDKRFKIGDFARTSVRIPTDPYPIYPPVDVVVEALSHFKGKRHKDAFGDWIKSESSTRAKVAYKGKSYWVDADTLSVPGAPSMPPGTTRG